MEPTKRKYDFIVIGLAVFAMFFGAGSLIFPPYLGMTSGNDWFLGFLCFFFTDVGLAFVTVVAMIRGTGKMSGMTGVIGKVPSVIINTVVLVCVGPLFIVPRSAATTFEMAIVPLPISFHSLIFSVLFFTIVWILAIRRSRLVDVIGKYLTPVMLVALLILIIVGVLYPLGRAAEPTSSSVVKDGIIAGYQAMDVLGALTVAIVVMANVTSRGYTEKKERVGITAKACVVAGGMLFLVYCGLTYLGASVSQFYHVNTVNQASLIVAITNDLFGFYGTLLLGIIVALASLTTAVGVASAVAAYFETLFGGKVSYSVLITIVILFSIVVSNFGLTTIIRFAEPVLSLVYPVIIVLIVLSFLQDKIKNPRVYQLATLFALLTSFCSVGGMPFVNEMPLAAYGFEWILPAVAGGLIGVCIPSKRKI